MSMYETSVILLCLTATMAYINVRFVKLPTTIGVMAISLVLSLGIIGLDALGLSALKEMEIKLLSGIDFHEVLMDVMLSMLLFAGALHVNLHDLKTQKWAVSFLALIGTLLSTAIVAGLTYVMLPIFGIELSLIWCLIFGALISPTDPIAVMGILKSAGAPKAVETTIAGESLFNDGIGVVLFTLLLGVLASGQIPSGLDIASYFALEAIGGMVFGFVLGAAGYYLLKSIDSYQEEVLITLALVLGGYGLAHTLHLSGPLAMVVTGLMLGNHGRQNAMSDQTRNYVDLFWELIDEILNAVLFVLIGLEIMVITLEINVMLAALVAIGIALIARTAAVLTSLQVLKSKLNLPKGVWKILTWGGLRGGISVALVLALPIGAERDLLLTMTYGIVLFSVLVQGLSVGRVAKKLR